MPVFQVNAAWAAMTEVIPNLYICGVSALKPSTIIALNFDLVVNCTKEVPNMNLPPDVDRLKLWLDDTEETDLMPHLHTAVDYIRMIMEVDGRVLVHCVAGVSRSAAVCLAYLVKYEHMTLRQAYDHMAALRARVRPNLGFWRQLIEFEMDMRNETSVRIVKFYDQELPDVYEKVTDENTPILTELPKVEKDPSSDDQSSKSTTKAREDRKRQRQLSDSDNGKRFVPKLEPVLENEP